MRYGLEGLTGLSPRHKAQQVSVPIATVPAPMTQGLSRMAWAAAGTTPAGLAGAPSFLASSLLTLMYRHPRILPVSTRRAAAAAFVVDLDIFWRATAIIFPSTSVTS